MSPGTYIRGRVRLPRWLAFSTLCAVLFTSPLNYSSTAQAQNTQESAPILKRYLSALAAKRLIASETGSVGSMRTLVRRGESDYLNQRYADAALRLFEVAESPAYADFSDEPEFHSAEFMLARSMLKLGALRTARRYLERTLSRGAANRYFAPAYRAYVQAALEELTLARSIDRLERLGDESQLPEDSVNELNYLRGRERFDAGDGSAADELFSKITKKSRFYANAQYLRGVIATRRGKLGQAEDLFCSITETGKNDRYSFYVDERFFEVKDLAHLALGRVAHEGGRSEDAFYYYFQVPHDSQRVAEAMFEAAYSMYEGGDNETAIDLLDQLEARFPNSPFVDEATLLRGYVHLGRCEFEKASELFKRFQDEYAPIVREIDRVLESPSRQEGFYEALLVEEDYLRSSADSSGKEAPTSSVPGTVLSMLRVDPDFYRLHTRVRTLDAEAARAGRLVEELDALKLRVAGKESPKAADKPTDDWADANLDLQLRADMADAQVALETLNGQLDALRGAGANGAELSPLEDAAKDLANRLRTLNRRAGRLGDGAKSATFEDSGDPLQSLLDEDLDRALGYPERIEGVRTALVQAANGAALGSLRTLRSRLASSLRRARIGRIDAVMGSKRRIELQIESLAAGRFPPELLDPLMMQGLLRDDEEYWPFEGEYWHDEFDESYQGTDESKGTAGESGGGAE